MKTNVFPRSFRAVAVFCLWMLSGLLLPSAALAQITIPPDGNILDYVGSPLPSAAVLRLQGNARMFGTGNHTDVALSPGNPELTLRAAGAVGSTITLNDNTNRYARFVTSSAAVITLIGQVTLTGGNASNSYGGALRFGGTGISIIHGNFNANNNSVIPATDYPAMGGAIYGSGAISFSDSVTLDGNRVISSGADAEGGAIYASGALNIMGGVMANRNSSSVTGARVSAHGGALCVDTGDLFVQGFASLNENSASAEKAFSNGGAIYVRAGNLVLSGGAQLNNNWVSIGTAHDNAFGGAIYVDQGNITINGPAELKDNSAITTVPSGVPIGGAIYIHRGDIFLNAVDGDIVFSENAHGAGKNAIYHNNAGLSVRPTIKLNVAANRTITFFDPLENRPYGGLMSVVKNGVGAVRFDATGYSNTNDRWSPIYARTQINEGTFEVANGAIYGMRAADVSSSEDSTFTMAPSTMLKGGGVTSWLRADQMMLEGVIFDLAGERLLSPSGQRNTFRIDSKNVSLDGSTVVFNTVLDGGSLPNTDKLIFSVNPFSTQTGPLTGNVAITIHNAGGVGGQTTGDGILLIEAIDGGELDATFTLSGGPITAGNYEYDLVQSNTHVYLQSTRSNGGGGGSKTAAIPTLGTGALVALVLVLGVVTLGTTRDKVKWMQV